MPFAALAKACEHVRFLEIEYSLRITVDLKSLCCVAGLFFGINVLRWSVEDNFLVDRRTHPDNVVWQAHNLVASSFGHLGEAFGLSLVFEGIAGEVYA